MSLEHRSVEPIARLSAAEHGRFRRECEIALRRPALGRRTGLESPEAEVQSSIAARSEGEIVFDGDGPTEVTRHDDERAIGGVVWQGS